jgi:hypothetical protein
MIRKRIGQGNAVNYDSGGVSIRINQNSSNSVNISCNGVRVGTPYEYEINHEYELQPGSKVFLLSESEPVELYFQAGNKARVEGETRSEPVYSDNKLVINSLKGKLWLPAGISDLEIAVRAMNGSVRGDIIHKGSIETMNGSIDLKLHAPMDITAFAMNGNIDITGMESKGDGKYSPNVPAVGALKVCAMNGNIKVVYQPVVLLPAPVQG